MNNKIKKIIISELGPHNNTEILLGDKITFINASNGTGKSIFASSFNHIDKEDEKKIRGWSNLSEIKMENLARRRNKIILNSDKKISWASRSTLKINVKVYDDTHFFDFLNDHYESKKLRIISNEQKKFNGLQKELFILKKIKKCNDKIEKLNKPSKDIINEFVNPKTKIGKYLKEGRAKIVAQKIIEIWNISLENIKKRIIHTQLSRTERAILRVYIEYKKNKMISFWKISSAYIDFSREDILLNEDAKKEVGKFKISELNKIKNFVIWFNIISSPDFRKLKFRANDIIEKMIKNDSYHDIDYDELLQIKENEMNDAKKAFQNKKNYFKNLSIIINKELSNIWLGKKIKLTKELIIKENKSNSEITLSSGEFKMLDLIVWLEEIKNNDGVDIVILDEPFTLIAKSYIGFIVDFFKKNLDKIKFQIIILTHSDIVTNTFQKAFSKIIYKKKRKKAFSIYSWKLNETFEVVSKKMNFLESELFKIYQDFCDKSNSGSIRLHSARKIMEYLSFSWNGHNEFSKLKIYKNGSLNIFGRKHNISR